MKTLRKMMALVIAMVMVLAMGVTVFAADTPHSITIKNTNESISINGKTYSAYKLFDSTQNADKTAYAYSMSTDSQFYDATLVTGTPATGSMAEVLKTYFTFTAVPGDSTKINVTPKDGFNADQARALADAIQPFLEDLTADATSPAAANETATITLPVNDAGLGYYIVTGDAIPKDPKSTETVESAVIITNEDPSPQINPKASIPTLKKEITAVSEDGTAVDNAVLDEAGQAAVAKVGSTVSYKLTSTVPDLTGYSDYTFILGDRLGTGLDYVKSGYELKINDATVTGINPVWADDDRSFTVTIPYNTLKTYTKGQSITFTYNATVNKDSLNYDFVNNTADLEYSRSPYEDTTNKTPEKKTYVININLDVDKIAEGDSSKKLDGATFKLYKEVTTTDNTDPENPVTSTSKLYYKWANDKVTWVDTQAAGDDFVTDTDGDFTQQVRGLDKGTYYFEETVAPKGYNVLASPVAVVINVSEATEGTDKDKVTYSATYAGQTADVTNGVVDLTAAQNSNQPVAVGVIENNSGSVLPSTGGIGTTIFYIVGAILVLGAGILLVTRRRMNAN